MILSVKAIPIIYLLPLISVSFTQLFGQTTYTWQGANNASWAVGANWTPTRTTPATNDILQFNSGTTLTITAVPSQTIGSFVMSGSTNITLLATGADKILTIGNGTGTDLDIQGGSGLSIGTKLNVTLAASSTANISGTLTVSAGRTYNSNGASVVTTVNGVINNSGTVTSASAASISLTSGSTYIHAQDGSAIPTATWDANSTCSVTGFNKTAIGGLNQNFGNFNWNCTGQTRDQSFPTTGTIAIAGTLEINSTGAGTNQLQLNQAALSVPQYTQIGGNFVIANATQSLTVTGNVTLSGGTLTMSSGSGIGTLNVAGDFSHTAGTITETSTGSGLIVFNKAGTQTYTSGGTVSNTINFTVNSGSALQMAAAGTIISGAGTFTLSSGATLGITSTAGITTVGTAAGNIRTTTGRTFNAGANYTYNGGANQVTGTGFPTSLTGILTIDNAGFTVTLDNAGTIASGGTVNMVNGIFDAGTNLSMATTSNITRSEGTMTGTPQGAGVYNVTYTGNSKTTTTELAGSGLNNVTVNLTAGQILTLDQNRSPDGDLNVQAGTFDLSTFTSDRSASGGTLAIAGILKVGGISNFPVNFSTITLTGSTVEYNGSNAITQTISAVPIYSDVTLTNGSGSGIAVKTLSGNTTINNDFTINPKCLFEIPVNIATTVAGTLNNIAGDSGLIVKLAPVGTGSLIHNTEGVNATFERSMTGNQWHILSSPVSGNSIQAFINSPLNNIPTKGSGPVTYGMEYYDEANGGWTYYTSDNIGSAGNFIPGRAYITRNAAPGVVNFSGTLNTGNISTAVTRNRFGWNAVGNPYSSSIGLNNGSTSTNFLDNNLSNLDPSYVAAYFWDESLAIPAYTIINNTSAITFIQPGQGFIVKANATGNVDFTTAMQIHANPTFYKKSSLTPWDEINLHVNNTSDSAKTQIFFRDDMSRGLDVSYDGGLFGGNAKFLLYTRLVEDNRVDFGIQCLPGQETESMVIPVGFDCEAGGLVSFHAGISSLPLGYIALLEDRQLGIFTNLKVKGSNYEVMITPGTKGTGRFYLHTMAGSTETDRNEEKINAFAVRKEIYIKGEVSPGAIASIYDLMGRKIGEYKLEPTDLNILKADSFKEGIYIVKVLDTGILKTDRLYIAR